MTHIRRMGLCLAAVSAIVAICVADASATEPIFQRVVVVPVKEGEKIPFNSNITKSTFETVGKERISCTGGSDKGAVTGPTALSLSATFKGCEQISSKAKCTSTGAAEGEIVTNTFEGKLGNIKSGSTPGVALFQPTGKTTDAEFTCGTVAVKLFGGVVGPITPVGSSVTKLVLLYKETAGIQLFENLFGGPLDTFSMSFGPGKAEQTGVNGKDTLVFPEGIQVS